jgi:hypothetical protein
VCDFCVVVPLRYLVIDDIIAGPGVEVFARIGFAVVFLQSLHLKKASILFIIRHVCNQL